MVCPECGKDFVGKGKFCNPNCTRKDWRRRKLANGDLQCIIPGCTTERQNGMRGMCCMHFNMTQRYPEMISTVSCLNCKHEFTFDKTRQGHNRKYCSEFCRESARRKNVAQRTRRCCKSPCAVGNCKNIAHARNLCFTHYSMLRKEAKRRGIWEGMIDAYTPSYRTSRNRQNDVHGETDSERRVGTG